MKRFSQVIFLCTSSTFFSPVAGGIYQKNAPDWMPPFISRGLVVLFEEPINPKCNVLLTQNGFSLCKHSNAKQIEKEDIKKDSLVLTMTLGEKVRFIEEFNYEDNVYTIGEFIGRDTDMLYPTDDDSYRETFDELVIRVNKVIQKIEELYWENSDEEGNENNMGSRYL